MAKSPRSHRFSVLRRIPMSLLSILVGVFCGMVVWVVLDQVQPRALRDIFAEELKTRLEQQARETLIRFENYVSTHTSTTRLLANHRRLANYLDPVYWFDSDLAPPVIYYQTPPWLPATSLWQTLVQPGQILLIDRTGRTREIFNAGSKALPNELLQVDELYLSESRAKAFLTSIQDKPFLLISETVEDATGTSMGYLMMVLPVGDSFLAASQQGISGEDVVVGLMDADEQIFLSTSDPAQVKPGAAFAGIAERYVVTEQSFFEYEGATLNLQFATLIPKESVDAIRERVAGVERRQRVVAAITFIAVFTLVFYLLSERLNRILQRISRFSRRALGKNQPVVERGNQILVLEDWIRQFMRQVLRARDEMRQQHESEMQESETLKQAIMEASLDAIITVSETQRIIEFNSTAERMFGFRRLDAIGKDFSALILEPGSHQRFREAVGSFYKSGSEASERRREMSAIRKDRGTFPVELAIKPILLKERLVFTVYVHDISNRKKAEQEISSLAKFTSESPNPVLRVNRLGVIIYANGASSLLLRYWGCEQGQTLPVYWRNRLNEVFQSTRNWETELICDGRTFSLLVTPMVEFDYVNIYGRDITAVRQAENQAREHQQELVHVCRLSTMGEMATGLAHELNQPLSAIANYANGCAHRLQSHDSSSEDLLYALGQINIQAGRAGEIIRRLRGLVAKQPPVRSVADISDLVREVCSFVEFESRKEGVIIEQQLALDQLPVRVDVVQIEQVLLNLIRNALDALREMPDSERSLVVRSSALDNGYVQVEVEDSGPGIDAEASDRLFEPFFTTKDSGMGMGLVISKTIVEDHNGRIEAKTLPAGGTHFCVLLPRHRGAEVKEAI